MYLIVKPKRLKGSLHSVLLILESLKFIDQVFYTDKIVVGVLEPKFVDKAKKVLNDCSKVSSYELIEEEIETQQITVVKIDDTWWFNGSKVELFSTELVETTNWIDEELTYKEDIKECEDGFCQITKPKEYFPPM